ncbi:MAG: hypothetical protein HRF43_13805 [Phycisphaerae bacterium]|jgi:hypothetical protein
MILHPRCIGVIVVLAMASAEQAALAKAVRYRLTPESGYFDGCVSGPCLCPIRGPIPVAGTFALEPRPPGPLFTEYAVTGVNWYVNLPEGRKHYTGEGTYRVGGEFAVQQQLELTLVDELGVARKFDSGPVVGGSKFPAINLTISATGMVCVNAAVHVVAEPARSSLYRLGGKSTYQQGCIFGFCDCVAWEPVPMKGTFRLTLIESNPLFDTYAVDEVCWSAAIAGQTLAIRGHGLYRYGGEVALTQNLELFLSVDGSPEWAHHLESGFVPAGARFPAIRVRAATHTNCFDHVVELQARPAADIDLSGAADLADSLCFQACVTGPAIANLNPDCDAADQDGDGDVDQVDYGLLQRCLGDDPMDCAE